MKTTWTIPQLKALFELREKGLTWAQIASEKPLKGLKSGKCCAIKYRRLDWDLFLKDPQNYPKDRNPQKWSHEEMVQLDAYLQADCSYQFIADKLSRSFVSVERQAQVTDWKAWKAIKEVESFQGEAIRDGEEQDQLLEQYVKALLTTCRNESVRLDKIGEAEFLARVNLDKSRLFIPFKELKAKATERLVEWGYGNPENLDLGAGRYVIVGDSHGKHTKKSMFELIRTVNRSLKPKKIIHIGHILDDDNDISYDWGKFDNLIVLTKIEELKHIQDQRNKFKFNYEIVRERVGLGDLNIFNQDLISDYVKTPIRQLDIDVFDERIVVNCHRLEFFTKCYSDTASYMVSPGCLCENHIIRTIKQIDFEDGRSVKQACWDGFSKYRRMRHTNKYWEHGLLIVDVDDEGNHTIVPCPIKETSCGYAIAYFDKILASKGIYKPDKKIFVNGDMHCDLHDNNILDIQEQICKDYKPDMTVNLGDTHNYLALNHHVMDRGGVILDKKILDEAAQTHFVLKRVAKWSKKNHLIYGNHERFARDFVEKYPQFGDYLDFRFLCALDVLGYKLTKLKDVLKIGTMKFIHGEIRMYGQTGSKLEKSARTFGKDVFIGHIHYPAIRSGCYSIGLTGRLDQEYNEPAASNWMHGFGLCNQFKGKSFPTTIAIAFNKCVINGKTYEPIDPNSWSVSKYEVGLDYRAT